MKKKLKALIEKRNEKNAEMQAMLDLCTTEVRALTEDEDARFNELAAEVRALDTTIARMQETHEAMEAPADEAPTEEVDAEATEVRALASYIRWGNSAQYRADVNLAPGDNGAIIPKTIASRIVKRIYEVSPILNAASKYTVKGQLDLPYYDESTGAITVGYVDEFTNPESTIGSFKVVTLKGYLARSMTKVSRSLMNSTDIDLVGFVVEDMSQQIARWLERELLLGTDSKVAGLRGCKNEVVAGATTAITLDDLISLQNSVIDYYQGSAMWIMHRKTREAIYKMKDGMNRPLIDPDIRNGRVPLLFGKPIYTSDSMPEMAAGKTSIYYGDMSGLAVKFSEQPNIQVLNELYAPQHAIGVVGFVEVDAAIQVEQAIAKLTQAAS